jgi:hypothetical protein
MAVSYSNSEQVALAVRREQRRDALHPLAAHPQIAAHAVAHDQLAPQQEPLPLASETHR